mgnify:CR=1 FL=1
MAKALQKVKKEMRGKEIADERVDQGANQHKGVFFLGKSGRWVSGAYALVVSAQASQKEKTYLAIERLFLFCFWPSFLR